MLITISALAIQSQSPLGSSYAELAGLPEDYPAVTGMPQNIVHQAIAQLQVRRCRCAPSPSLRGPPCNVRNLLALVRVFLLSQDKELPVKAVHS